MILTLTMEVEHEHDSGHDLERWAIRLWTCIFYSAIMHSTPYSFFFKVVFWSIVFNKLVNKCLISSYLR